MEDKIISPMQDFLPGALSRWILGLSIAVSGSLLLLPSYDLPAKYLSDPDIIKLLMRLLSAGMPLLIGLIALIVLQVRHNRKTSHELTDAKSENKAYFHQVSSLNTDKNTLQTLLDETKRNFSDLTKKQISLRESNSKLDELNKIHLAEISRLSAASNQYIQDFQDLRDLLTASQKALQQSKDECNARLLLLKEKYEKDIEELKSPPASPQRSFPGPKIPIEPASASSELGPDDYHAKRRSFFHTDNDRPKRR
jgi:hypothetical protein